MTELNLSLIFGNDDFVPIIQQTLNKFSTRFGIKVNLHTSTWETAWSDLIDSALHNTKLDISEVGSSWVDSFASMQVLHPLTQFEIAQIGGESIFLPSSWQSCSKMANDSVWAIPWVSDVRTIYYRRDLLQQAGVDEATAFKTPTQLINTLERLQKNGVEIPLAIPTTPSATTIQVLASWIWGSGGHFINNSGHQLRFNEPRTKAAITTYFKLYHYIAPSVRKLYDDAICELFCKGKVAVITGGYWVLQTIKQGHSVPEVANNLGMAIMPGVPFVGGSNLVVWKYSYQTTATLKLVRHLTSRKTQQSVIPQCGWLPTRLDVLNEAPFTTEPYYQIIKHSLQQGRSFQAAYIWGVVEDRLKSGLSELWSTLFANPELNLEDTVSEYIDAIYNNLNLTLS